MTSIDEQALSDFDRSNKGASKQRRDQINTEISIMRELLPLPESARQRLSQLQIMSLICVYIRKCNVLQKLFGCNSNEAELPDSMDFFQALTGFLLATTTEGKLLYISENVTDFLGHSMVDMKTQGDSLYDIVDKRDHRTVQAQLMNGQDSDGEVSFLCRMNLSRTLKRQPGFGDVKVMHVRGHFKSMNTTEPGCLGDNQRVFMATCSSLVTPDSKENLTQTSTMIFKTIHKMDMTFLGLNQNGEHHLGYTNEQLVQRSWYYVLHPEDILEAKEKHTQLIRTNHETGCMLTVRMLRLDGSIFWVNIVMRMHQACLATNDEPLIVCTNQVIDAHEAYQIKVQGHVFSMHPSSYSQESHQNSVCSPTQNNFGSQWIPQHVSNAIPVSENPTNIPNYIEHAGSLDMHFSKYPSMSSPTNKSATDCALESQSSAAQLSHLKAMLKRKIERPQVKSCKPAKSARMSWNIDSLSWNTDNFSDVTGQGISQKKQDKQTTVSASGSESSKMQVMQSTSYTVESITANNMSMKQPACQGSPKANYVISEQIVPDSYLTPDPSPASSPQSSCLPVETRTLHPTEKATVGKSESIQALEKLAALPHMNTAKTVAVKEKELPILDPSYIESFFKDEELDELKTSIKMEDQQQCVVKKKLLAEQVPSVNIPSFLRDERISPSPCIHYHDPNDVLSNIKPSPYPHIPPSYHPHLQLSPNPQAQPSSHLHVQPLFQSQILPSSQPQAQHQIQVQPHSQSSFQHQMQPQIQHSSRHQMLPQILPFIQPQTQKPTQTKTSIQPHIIQPKIQPSSQPHFQPHFQPQIEPSFKPQMQPHMQSTFQAKIQPSFQPQIQPQFQPQIKPSQPNDHPQVKPSSHAQPQIKPSPHAQPQIKPFSHAQPQIKFSIPHSYIPTSQEALITCFNDPRVFTNTSDLHSNNKGYHLDMHVSNTVVLSPQSITSEETNDDFLNCLSDDDINQIHLETRNNSTSEDLLDIFSDQFFYMQNCTKMATIGTQHMSELDSPQSCTSSLEDELFDTSDLDLGTALNDLIAPCQMIFTSSGGMKDQDALGMSSDVKVDFSFNSWLPLQDSCNLNMIKHSQ